MFEACSVYIHTVNRRVSDDTDKEEEEEEEEDEDEDVFGNAYEGVADRRSAGAATNDSSIGWEDGKGTCILVAK
jgi:hypothetical protein